MPGTTCEGCRCIGRQACKSTLSCRPHDVQVILVVAGEQHIHLGEFELVRSQLLRHVSMVERQLAPLLPSPRQGLISAIGAEVRTHEKGHIQGHRYTLTDSASEADVCASTPLHKLMAATSQTCQATLSMVWQDCQHHLAADSVRTAKAASGPAARASRARAGDDSGAGPSSTGADEVADGAVPIAEDGEGDIQAEELTDSGAAATFARTGATRLEMLAQAPNRKWVQAKWSLCAELLHIDDVSSKDSNSLASANRNAQSMLSTYFPGVMGL
jgi:hypothetical protein